MHNAIHSFFLRSLLPVLALLLLGLATRTQAQTPVNDVCPLAEIQARGPEYGPGGLILTTFDRESLWVYDVARNARYPLPETMPCSSNCRLSQDARWITFINAASNTYNKMRLDGTERTLLVEYAADVEWWSADTLLIWTPSHRAYLRAETGTAREYLPVDGVISVQPGGRWGVLIEQDEDAFARSLVNLTTRNRTDVTLERQPLGPDLPFFNASAWSPDGSRLAYVAPAGPLVEAELVGGEIYSVSPGEVPVPVTNLTSAYGPVRIGGSSNGLSWSPDGSRLAFWVMPLTGPDPTANAGSASLHVLELASGQITRYCGYNTRSHTPNPPRLIWSPDGTHIAFGAAVAGDERGYLLLGLNTADGTFTELSVGLFPAFGAPDVIAWGLAPCMILPHHLWRRLVRPDYKNAAYRWFSRPRAPVVRPPGVVSAVLGLVVGLLAPFLLYALIFLLLFVNSAALIAALFGLVRGASIALNSSHHIATTRASSLFPLLAVTPGGTDAVHWGILWADLRRAGLATDYRWLTRDVLLIVGVGGMLLYFVVNQRLYFNTPTDTAIYFIEQAYTLALAWAFSEQAVVTASLWALLTPAQVQGGFEARIVALAGFLATQLLLAFAVIGVNHLGLWQVLTRLPTPLTAQKGMQAVLALGLFYLLYVLLVNQLWRRLDRQLNHRLRDSAL